MTETTVKTSSNAVNAAIKAVTKTAGAYNAAVQTAIVLIMRHSHAFDDCTGAERLLNAMPQSNRRSLVVAHFEQYSPINVRKDGKAFKASLRKPDDKKYNPYDIDGAVVNNWWERPEAGKLPDIINLDAVKGDFDTFINRELKKADTVEAEANEMPEGAERTNRMSDAVAIRSFVTRIRDMVSVASAPAVPAANTNTDTNNAGVVEKAA